MSNVENELKDLIIRRYGSLSDFCKRIDLPWSTLDSMTYTKPYMTASKSLIYRQNSAYCRGFKSPSRYFSKFPLDTAIPVFKGFFNSMGLDYIPKNRIKIRTLVHVSYTTSYMNSDVFLLI